jgi:hypothetical protein
MRGFIGLTQQSFQEYYSLIDILEELGTNVEEASLLGLLNEREQNFIRMVRNLEDHPEFSLWNQDPSTL